MEINTNVEGLSKTHVLRIILTQNNANYKKEETVDNKMTYPLPPFSTVIGAIHNACGFKSYVPMDISIQGTFGSMVKRAYTDYCFLNSLQNDRGILVKLSNKNAQSSAFEKVAKAKKGQGNDFYKGITIDVLNQTLIDEYRSLKDLNNKIDAFKKSKIDPILGKIKRRIKCLDDKNRDTPNDIIVRRKKELQALKKTIETRLKEYKSSNYDIPISRFATVTTSLKHYEILTDVKLILHIKSDEQTLQTILDNVYNITAIGRSEDFVDIQSAQIVELKEGVQDEVTCKYPIYLNYDVFEECNNDIDFNRRSGIPANGTKYYLNKHYVIDKVTKKRIFDKKKVLYVSNFIVYDGIQNIYIDDSSNETFVVSFN